MFIVVDHSLNTGWVQYTVKFLLHNSTINLILCIDCQWSTCQCRHRIFATSSFTWKSRHPSQYACNQNCSDRIAGPDSDISWGGVCKQCIRFGFFIRRLYKQTQCSQFLGPVFSLNATREVILSAGAVKTPHLRKLAIHDAHPSQLTKANNSVTFGNWGLCSAFSCWRQAHCRSP